jgi:hypothetical protein
MSTSSEALLKVKIQIVRGAPGCLLSIPLSPQDLGRLPYSLCGGQAHLAEWESMGISGGNSHVLAEQDAMRHIVDLVTCERTKLPDVLWGII